MEPRGAISRLGGMLAVARLTWAIPLEYCGNLIHIFTQFLAVHICAYIE